MCGIGGVLHKNAGAGALAPIGTELVRMMEAMKHRGMDSTGLTVAGEDVDEDLIVRLRAEPDREHEDLSARVKDVVARLGGIVSSERAVGEFLRLGLNYEGDVRRLAEALVKIEGIVIHSIGERSEVIKDVGTGSDLDGRHGVRLMKGTHGIGHVRLATESRVDITHAHPFWAFPFPDVAVVHNGQLTNYHKLKRSYEDRGYHFQTENDSELIAVYLADKLNKGATLQSSLEDALIDLDGTFTFLVSTKTGLGYAKDQWAAKPLVAMETEDVVALASEEVALRSVFPSEIERVEPQQSEVMTWSL
jgi:glutamate synthase domain-containing protein 1